ncbi:bifunctional diaminohydroxyphosphoribosylaminopyrimidine deaminase/5-amino-6-(5-phosphoribosylamino)uracil reductase RibD [Streptomyces sp. S399]|nr:bifunctional diaminohydroxyphosphoribosylaminopyrimidine deaminase/5-amino-6-(5-phosphoribosylamino)uracil reductase RibD [Streptomyces sp. S399]WPR54592.1 bifunctional diaminohydroxyphosphoribosylaminopyrimidine deaminase/5-amino-6-(5-phosphoribosylamino)uracil reductase RibD [Streptomyces sp. S399]
MRRPRRPWRAGGRRLAPPGGWPARRGARPAGGGGRARGGTALVTLEPCNHTGRTAPCARALVEAGVRRVVYAVADPDPRGEGGAATLRAAGVETAAGLLGEEAERVNAAWLTSVRRGRPHITWKYAATLDGRTAAADGTSRWITSAEARADVHRLRAEADAVLVGSGTARADDPHLAARLPAPAPDAPRPYNRCASSSTPPPPPYAPAPASSTAPPPPWSRWPGTPTPDTSRTTRTPRCCACPAGGGLDLTALLDALHAREVRSVLLEGGARLARAPSSPRGPSTGSSATWRPRCWAPGRRH